MCCAGEGKIQTEGLVVLPADLRDLKGMEAGLLAAGFDPNLPTYVLAECVLVYMEAHESAAVVRWLGSFLSSAACVVYEQVRTLGYVAAAEQSPGEKPAGYHLKRDARTDAN